MKILNLYCGIGGNRKLWTPNGDEHEITAVEIDEKIAEVYNDMYPKDIVIICDAHKYLLNNYHRFDFIWSSPPCPSHSRARFGLGVHGHGYPYIYPDMSLYQQILLLKSLYDGRWCVENVIPYYDYLIEPSIILGRHPFWCNFRIAHEKFTQNAGIAGHTCKGTGEREFHSKRLGIDLDKYSGIDKRLALRNCVEPEVGLHILNCAMNIETINGEQGSLF